MLAQMLLGCAVAELFVVLVTARAHFCKIDGRVLSRALLGYCLGVLFEALVTVRVHFCEMDGRVLGMVRAQF